MQVAHHEIREVFMASGVVASMDAPLSLHGYGCASWVHRRCALHLFSGCKSDTIRTNLDRSACPPYGEYLRQRQVRSAMGKKRHRGPSQSNGQQKKRGKQGSVVARAKEIQAEHARRMHAKVVDERKQAMFNQRKEKYKRQIARVPYVPHLHILLVGEGNFSFARALARYFVNIHTKSVQKRRKKLIAIEEKRLAQLGTGKSVNMLATIPQDDTKPGERLIATSYDSLDELRKKYEDAQGIIKEVAAAGSTVLHSVDATNLEGCATLMAAMPEDGFDRIVFNFPHTGCGIKDTLQNNKVHQAFLQAFFRSAAKLLRTGDRETCGEIHVTLKKGEPYDSWQVPRMARVSGAELEHKNGMDFYASMYSGYEHRRTLGETEGVAEGSELANEDIRGGARTYVFRAKLRPIL
jgi:hypothetical protein